MNSMLAHISIVQHPNLQCRTYNVNRLLSGKNIRFGVDEILDSFDKQNRDPGSLKVNLAKDLDSILGIGKGNVGQYDIHIVKGVAFDWSDIGPLVIAQIIKHLFPKSIGNTIEISTTCHYNFGETTIDQRIAIRRQVPVSFKRRQRRPRFDIEQLFNSSEIENPRSEVSAPVGSNETPASEEAPTTEGSVAH